MKKGTLAKVLGSGLIGASALFSSINKVNGEILRVTNSGSGTGASSVLLEHIDGAQEGGPDGFDGFWESIPPNPVQPEMKIISKPYSTELNFDSRPLTSESIFNVELKVVDRNNPGAIINTVTNRLRFKFDEPADSGRVYLTKLNRYATNNPSGMDINLIINIVDLINVSGGTQGFLNLPGITNVPHDSVYGTLDVSCAFTNRPIVVTGKNIAVGVDLSNNLVSGLQYNVNTNGLEGVLSGTAPSLNYLSSVPGIKDFSYDVLDDNSNVVGTFYQSINVTNVNSAPLATNQVYSLRKNSTREFTYSAGDDDGDSVMISDIIGPSSGVISTNAEVYSYVPNLGFTGSDEIAFRVSDGALYSNWATNFFNVTNSAPVAIGASASGPKNLPLLVALPVSDPDGDSLEVLLSSGANHGSAVVTNGTNIFYMPNTNYVGSDEIMYYAQDTDGARSSTNNISLQLTNRSPVAQAVGANAIGENSVVIGLQANDPDGDALTYNVSQPDYGAFSLDGNNVTYTAPRNFYGNAQGSYDVSDGMTNSLPAGISVSVAPVSWQPRITGFFPSGMNYMMNVEAQPGRAITPEFVSAIASGSMWASGSEVMTNYTQQVPMSTNLYNLISFSLPKGTNNSGFYRVQAKTE